MAFVLADRVKESSITSGTSDLVLGAGSFGGFETFSQGVGDGNQTYYGIENFSRWEVGIGTYTGASDILSRDTVLASSNSDGKISLDGISVVFCTYPGGQSFLLDANGVASGISSSYTGVGFPDGTVQITAPAPSGHLAEPGDGSVPFTMVRTTAGNLFHAYVDNAADETVGLHLQDATLPTWKLGLKDTPSSATEAPSYGYVYGKYGGAGMYATSDTSALVNYSNGFWVTHQSSSLLNVGRTAGLILDNASASTVGVTVRGAAGQSAYLQKWSNSSDTVLAYISAAGGINIPSITFSDGTSQTTSSKAGVKAYTSVSTDTTLSNANCVVFVDSSSVEVDVTLPTAVGNGGKTFMIKRVSAGNNVVIKTHASENIDGASIHTLSSQYDSVTVVSNDGHWFIF